MRAADGYEEISNSCSGDLQRLLLLMALRSPNPADIRNFYYMTHQP